MKIEQTKTLLETLPPVNTVTTYGSGYFKQETNVKEKKSKDLIISVDNPAKWHAQNLLQNPQMYIDTGLQNLIDLKEMVDPDHEVSFPQSISCFFADFQDQEYKFLVVDKKLLYQDLQEWTHFSLAGRMQKETTILVDNSSGLFPELLKQNYTSAIKTALLLNPGEDLDLQKYLETIVSLSYLGDLRKLFHIEDPNKIPNIINGSYDFFKQTYCQTNEFQIQNGFIHKNETYRSENLPQKIDELPRALRNYLYNMIPVELTDPKIVAKTIQKYFKTTDFQSSYQLMFRCNRTVGPTKSWQTAVGKVKKGLQKTKRK